MKITLSFCLTLLLFLSLKVEALVVVVSKDNTTTSLTKEQVIDIYMGRFVTFPNGKSAKPLDLPTQSEMKSQFYQKLVNKSERKINAYWARLLFSGRAKPPEEVESIQSVIAKLQNSESTIGYIPANAVNENVKVVYRFD